MSRGLLAQRWLSWKSVPSPRDGSQETSVSADRELLRLSDDGHSIRVIKATSPEADDGDKSGGDDK